MIRHDPERRLYEIAWPMGVVAALIPSTNPTSTAFNKALIAVKARNAIVISPHPSAVRCTYEAVQTMAMAAENAGAPRGLISCLHQISLPGTQELMRHRHMALILATGGTAMVRAAHSTGKPAYGVGPGNVPVYVDRSADVEKAARYIVASKAFDYSTICATEQSVIADRPIAASLAELMQAEGAYFTDDTGNRCLAPGAVSRGWQHQHRGGRQTRRLRRRLCRHNNSRRYPHPGDAALARRAVRSRSPTKS